MADLENHSHQMKVVPIELKKYGPILHLWQLEQLPKVNRNLSSTLQNTLHINTLTSDL